MLLCYSFNPSSCSLTSGVFFTWHDGMTRSIWEEGDMDSAATQD